MKRRLAPVANDDSYTTPSDTQLVVAAPGYLANDTGLSGGEAPIFLGSTSNGSFAHQPRTGAGRRGGGHGRPS